MKKVLKVIVPLLLSFAIIFSIGWYLFEYDPTFTRDVILKQARRLEDDGKHSLAVWFYNLAYRQSNHDEQVAIELAEQFKAIGNYTKAEYTLSKAIEDGGSTDLYVALCKTYVEQNKLRDAVLMLDKVSNPDIKAELDAMRPPAPVPSAKPGFYSQYISLEISAPDTTLYVTTNKEYPCKEEDQYTDSIPLDAGETTIFALCVGENGLVSPLSVFNYTIGGVIEEVVFSDNAVETALREQLEIQNDRKIFSNELWEVSEFEIPSAAHNCDDLKWLPHLKKLTINGCTFKSMDAIAELTDLETLIISESIISAKDLENISSLPLLQSLTLESCNISSIANLEQATGLVHLDLSNNSIRDIQVLSNMPQLQELDLSSNAIVSVEDLANLKNLQMLDISYNSLVTTEPLGSLTTLTRLDVSGNSLWDLEGIQSLVNLTHFAAAYNNLIHVDQLELCTELVELDISNNTLLNIDVLKDHVKLQNLNFSYNEVAELPAFKWDAQLVTINGEHNVLESLDALSGLSKLQTVSMDYNPDLRNINSLVRCKSLKTVNVYGTKVSNVDVLVNAGVLVNYNPI